MVTTQHKASQQQHSGNVFFRPKVTLLVPVKKNAGHLADCLESIRSQTYPADRLEIILTEKISGDRTRRLIREFSKQNSAIKVRRATGKLGARGKAHSHGSDEVVLSLSPNAILSEHYIESVVRGLQPGEAVAAIGGRVIYRGTSYWGNATAAALSSELVFPIATADAEATDNRREGMGNAAYRRQALVESGLLEQELVDNPYEAAARLTHKQLRLRLATDIVSFLSLHQDLFGLLGLAGWHGLSWSVKLRKTWRHSRWWYASVPLLVLIAVISIIPAMLGAAAVKTVLVTAALLYAAHNITTAARLARCNRWRYLPALPPILAIIHLGFTAGFFAGLITGRRWGTALPRWLEKSAVLLSDYIAINAAFFTWAYLRSEMGLFSVTRLEVALIVSNAIFIFWMSVFLLSGLYRSWTAASRFEEALAVFKIVGLGVLVIFVITFEWEHDFTNPVPASRMMLVSYWLIVAGAVTTGRMVIRTMQRRLLENGIGQQRTVIVGWGKKARNLYREVQRFPALGYRVIGFISLSDEDRRHQFQGVPVIGSLRRLGDLILRHEVENVLIAPQKQDEKSLMRIITQTEGLPVSLKIVPDMYSIITGQARTNQIYGFPLMEILPQYMPAWERIAKRTMDITISFAILALGLPLWLLVAIAIKLESHGPVFYRQLRVGKNGMQFHVIKFRSMVADAEKGTGPKWAEKRDPRITRVGWIIRKWRIDEVPQFFNVLKGEMSIVGPRPERPFFVEQLRKAFPLYTRRQRVQPGITGWAQVKGHYDTSIENVKIKLQYDLFYLENMSLKMDIKILIHTVYVMLAGKGQ